MVSVHLGLLKNYFSQNRTLCKMKICWRMVHRRDWGTASFSMLRIQSRLPDACDRFTFNSHLKLLFRSWTYSQIYCQVKDYHEYSKLSDIPLYIKENTRVCSDHLTPEILLHLITPDCTLWTAKPEDCLVPDPYWAFYWPGGQALTRYLLDNPDVVDNKTVLDVGSGCGASAIASALRGAKQAIANDICPAAIEAIKLNASINNAEIQVTNTNLIGHTDASWDVVVMGDMFYDDDFTNHAADWLQTLWSLGKTVLIGDPGRIYLTNHRLKRILKEIAVYELSPQTKQENNGLTHGYVWTFPTRTG